MQTPKPLLQLRALGAQASSYLRLWAHSCSLRSPLGYCPQPCSFAEPPPQGRGLPTQGRGSCICCSLNLGNSSKVFPMCPALVGLIV